MSEALTAKLQQAFEQNVSDIEEIKNIFGDPKIISNTYYKYYDSTIIGQEDFLYISFMIGDSTCGQRALYPMGMTGIPIFNVNNNCATGSSALFLANQMIQGGLSDCVLALGFEKMQRGSLTSQVSLKITSKLYDFDIILQFDD